MTLSGEAKGQLVVGALLIAAIGVGQFIKYRINEKWREDAVFEQAEQPVKESTINIEKLDWNINPMILESVPQLNGYDATYNWKTNTLDIGKVKETVGDSCWIRATDNNHDGIYNLVKLNGQNCPQDFYDLCDPKMLDKVRLELDNLVIERVGYHAKTQAEMQVRNELGSRFKGE